MNYKRDAARFILRTAIRQGKIKLPDSHQVKVPRFPAIDIFEARQKARTQGAGKRKMRLRLRAGVDISEEELERYYREWHGLKTRQAFSTYVIKQRKLEGLL